MPDYDDGLVEATAKAIALEIDGYAPDVMGDDYRIYLDDRVFVEPVRLARAAIAAVLEWQGKAGYVLAPAEPTPEMIVAGIAERHDSGVPEAWSKATANVYRAMLAAL